MTTISTEPTQTPTHPDQTRLAIAALAACFAVSHAEQSESFLPAFEDALKNMFHHIRNTTLIDNSEVEQTLRWTNDFVQTLKNR